MDTLYLNGEELVKKVVEKINLWKSTIYMKLTSTYIFYLNYGAKGQ